MTVINLNKTREITSSEDVIDSRDVIDRIAWLESERDYDPEGWTADLQEELLNLHRLAEQGEHDVSDWQYGEALIRYSYFTAYCRELIEDCGYISKDFPAWIEIDWDATARNMRVDYVELTFDGITYLAR